MNALTPMPPARLEILFARDTERAVILRRGPTRATAMILWDTRHDRFTEGQWIKHKIYAERSHLSPDGRHLIWFGYRGMGHDHRFLGGFTAISRPPFFTARAFFPQGETWGGGGTFVDNRHVWIRSLFARGARERDLPDGLKAVFHPAAISKNLCGKYRSSMLVPDHFVYADGRRAAIKHADMERLRAEHPLKTPKDVFFGMPAPPLPDWCVVRDGCLYRRRQNGDDGLLRDFNAMEFKELRAPYG
ncbi:MAG: hypothetical protein R3D60_10025 [Paracoccaceae bacterium]